MDVKAAIECLSKMIVEYEERSKKYTYNGATEVLGYKILKEKIDALYTARSNLKHNAWMELPDTREIVEDVTHRCKTTDDQNGSVEMSERQVEEGQVWAFREDEHSQYSEYLLVDAVCDDCFSHRAGHIKYIRPVTFLLDNPEWELLDAEKICELLYKQREYIRIIHESAEHGRQLISARDFAEQEVKEKERICESMQTKLTQVMNELDVEREKRTHVEKRNCELEEKLEEIERELANTKDKNIVLRAVLEGFNGNVENLQKCLVELFENFVSKISGE